MRKIIFIVTVIILVYGCAISRRQSRTAGIHEIKRTWKELYQSILYQNITERNFFIERAEFKIKSEEGEKSGIGTIKFLTPDKFLISIKNNTGIEIARIYLTGDSIMLNERMNKKLYYGSAFYLKKKYGLTTSIIPVLLGDYINNEKLDSNSIKCNDGRFTVNGIVGEKRIKYVLDCQLGKSILAIPEQDTDSNGLEIRYDNFFNSGGVNIPGRIQISEKQNNTEIEIRIEKITIPWSGTIEFIPGKQYEKIPLL